MRLVVCSVLLVVACDSGEPYPIVPGGDDTTITPGADAAVDAPGDGIGGVLEGRVCVLLDPRVLTSCADAGAAGITVTLGTAVATTADDGTFTLVSPGGSSLVWFADGPQIVPTATPLGAAHLIPALPVATYTTLLTNHSVVGQTLHGQVFVRLLRQGVPLAGVIASVDPPSLTPALYDGLTATAWNIGQTGDLGVAWLPDVPAGGAIVTLRPPVGNAVDLVLAVGDQTTSYATVEFP